ncbi:MAG: hypothetical protein KA190_17995 [Kofleriaceae bacterium]|nr:hypothetical protein [Kofleriaceae bacterium]
MFASRRAPFLPAALAVLLFAGPACKDKHKGTPAGSATGSAAGSAAAAAGSGGDTIAVSGADRDRADAANALWKLAPAGTRLGVVITAAGLQLLERGRTRLDQLDGPWRPALAEAWRGILGSAATLADAGLSTDLELALFGLADQAGVIVLPVVDRARFVASHGGTAATSPDGHDQVGQATCTQTKHGYACASAAPLLAQLATGAMTGTVAVPRGQVEVQADLAALAVGANALMSAPRWLGLSVVLTPGAAVVRVRAQGTLAEPWAKLATTAPLPIDTTALAGFLSLAGPTDWKAFVAALDAPAKARVVFDELAGAAQVTIPAGSSDLVGRVPLAGKGGLVRGLITGCAGLPGFEIAADGSCQTPALPQLGRRLSLWIDGDDVRVGTRRQVAAGVPLPMTSIGAELAGGRYNLAAWGRGLMLGLEGLAAMVPGEIADQAMPSLLLLQQITEFGLGVKFDSDAVSGVIALRTVFTNPDDVLAAIQPALTAPIGPGAAQARLAAVEAAATKFPSSPLAGDVKAGPFGMTPATFALGAAAAVAIPAFVKYQRRAAAPPPAPGGESARDFADRLANSPDDDDDDDDAPGSDLGRVGGGSAAGSASPSAP